jgi:UDP-N-acetylglucosamine--dolichyl-phosphate N-acetylglucosaminephosphotransferase
MEIDLVFFAMLMAILISFTSTYIVMPIFIKFMRSAGIVGVDIMKKDSPIVADMGGPGVITGFLTGVFFYIAIMVFHPNGFNGLIYLLASLNTILIITLVGIFDVLTGLIKAKEGDGIFEKLKRRGIPAWAYFLLPLPAAIPIMAVNAGVSTMVLPFLGKVNFGVLYPLLLVPLGILCCSNATNFLAGFNGLEAGLGLVLHTSLGIYAFINGELSAAILSLTFAAGLLAFLAYNWYPSKVFPGDLNYTIGATVACVAIVGNMEKFAILVFLPWILEALLKAISRFQAESFGVISEDGAVKPRQASIRSLTHLVMRMGDFKEWQVTMILIILEIIVCLTSFLIVPLI